MKSKKEGSLTPLSLLSNNVSVQHSATRVARHTSKHKIISTNILSKSLQHKLFPKHPGDGKEQERIGKPSGSHCQSGRIHLDRDGWSMGIEQRGSISDQRERAALINGHRTRRKSRSESDAPASQRDAPRDRLTGTHSEYKAKGSWPGAAANQSVSNIETSIPHWPPSWDILRRNERLIERAREGLEFSARERERRGSARKTRSGADRTARARAEWSYRTNANLRYWIGLLKTIIETVLNKRQKTRDGVSVFNRAPRGAGAGGGCWMRFIRYKKRVYTVIDFLLL